MTESTGVDSGNSHAKWLRQAAAEIAKAGHNGWGNTCLQAADEMDRLCLAATEAYMQANALLERGLRMADEIDALRLSATARDAELAQVRERLNWAANELLACDYGDNGASGEQVGWIVYGWRDRTIFNAAKPHREKRRIYGPSIDQAIDKELAK